MGLLVMMNQKTGYAFNLSICCSCGTICKEDVWKDPGHTWFATDGRLVKILPGTIHAVEIKGTLTL